MSAAGGGDLRPWATTGPTWRGSLRQVAWDDVTQVRGKVGGREERQVLELADGRTVVLPRGVPADLVERQRADKL